MLSITHPVPYEVIQRANNNIGYVLVEGTCELNVTRIVVEFVPIESVIMPKQGTASGRFVIVPIGGRYAGRVPVAGGWYRLIATSYTDVQAETASVEHVGVGEVFVLFGHSVPQADETAYVGAEDERVTAPLKTNEQTASVDFEFGRLGDNSPRGPFNKMPGPHGLTGDLLVKRLNVPVAFYGANFGGSNIELNYKVINGIPFGHGFISYERNMPFEPLKRSLLDFASKTGVRAVISQHGINDAGRDENAFYSEYKAVIDQTRNIFDSALPWVVILDDNGNASIDPQRAGIRRLWNTANVYPGFDFREITSMIPRDDKVHPKLSTEWAKYAELLNASINDDFLSRSAPVLVKSTAPIATPETANVTVVQPKVKTASLLQLPDVGSFIPEELRQDWKEISTPTKILGGVILAVLLIAIIVKSND
jgi:hypothetical protein